MKKSLAVLLVLVLCCFALAGCGEKKKSEQMETKIETETDNKTNVSSVVLSTNTAEVQIGEEINLSCIVLPESEKDTVISWKSADDSIATVDDSGKVVGIAVGQTNIVASADNGVNDVCTITVKELSAYERMTDKEKDFADVMLKSLQYFNNPKTVSVTYAYYNSGTDTWSITVSAQNQMGGYTETDFDLQRNGEITKPIFNHIKTGLDSHFDLTLINEYISDYANR